MPLKPNQPAPATGTKARAAGKNLKPVLDEAKWARRRLYAAIGELDRLTSAKPADLAEQIAPYFVAAVALPNIEPKPDKTGKAEALE